VTAAENIPTSSAIAAEDAAWLKSLRSTLGCISAQTGAFFLYHARKTGGTTLRALLQVPANSYSYYCHHHYYDYDYDYYYYYCCLHLNSFCSTTRVHIRGVLL
jgi:hypothetical protein